MNKKTDKINKTKEAFNKIMTGVENIINSGEYERFLKFSKNFHNYSFNNRVLIYSQMKNATKVAGFKKWQSLGRKLKKGSKGIQIIYPIKRTYNTKIEGQENLLDNNPENKQNVIEKEYFTYRITYVYDISQTVGKPVPMEQHTLNSNNKMEFFDFLKEFSPYPILEGELLGGTQGVWRKDKEEIILKKNLSIDDKASVLLHELTHALYDDFDYKENRDLSETFVESVAYIVADYFDLDTSMCSFNYITSWASGDIKTIIQLGDKIQKTANNFIERLEKSYNNGNLKIAC